MAASNRRKFLKTAMATSALVALSHAQANVIISPATSFIDQELDYDAPPKSQRINPIKIFAQFKPETIDPVFGNARKSHITWQFSTEQSFADIVSEGSMIHLGEESFSLDVSLEQIPPGATIYARFLYKGCALESQIALGDADYRYTVKPKRTIKTSLLNVRKKILTSS